MYIHMYIYLYICIYTYKYMYINIWAMLTTPEPVGVTIAKMHKWSWSLINRCIIIYRG